MIQLQVCFCLLGLALAALGTAVLLRPQRLRRFLRRLDARLWKWTGRRLAWSRLAGSGLLLLGTVLFLVLLAALLFGPGAGFAVGAVADIIGGVLAGYAINPLITLGAGAIGLVAGYAWQKLPDYRTGLRLSISVLLGHFVGSMVINSLALRIFYGYAWSVLLARIPNALVLSAVNIVLLRILLENRSLMKLAKK